MPDTIRQHDYADGKCLHCGDRQGDNTGINSERGCISREVPRAVPESIFAKIEDIGAVMREIRVREGREQPAEGI